MPTCHIVDAFPAFLEFWPTIRHKTIEEQIDAWTTSYMARWPELLAKQQACYAEDGEDWRQQRDLPNGLGPWWQLYSEGFAQRCEYVILKGDSWHMARRVEGWQDWCQANEGWLAAEFLRAVDGGASLRPFFGSWYDIRGWKQTGYYLGHRVIRHLEASMDLHEIALLDEIEPLLRHELEHLAVAGG